MDTIKLEASFLGLLLKQAADKEEEAKLAVYKNRISELTKADAFLLTISEVPVLSKRLEVYSCLSRF